jgi:guanine nucleotide-binding protein G(I)/G(S)/G(T) subunit beta-1
VNSVAFFPDGNAVGTGSDDTSCRIFDMRCASELGAFGSPQILSGITSGEWIRYLFASQHNYEYLLSVFTVSFFLTEWEIYVCGI